MEHKLRMISFAIAVVLSGLGNIAKADPILVGDYYFNEAGNTIVGVVGWISGDIVLPTTVTYGGYTTQVTSIGAEAFSGATGITSVEIPEGYTRIGMNAFRGCSNIRKITIPRSVAYVASWGYYPDQGLSSLDTMNIFGSAFNTQTISGMIGNSRTHLKVLTIGDSMTTVPSRFAEGCDSLVSVNITTPMEQIGYEAFRGCGELTSINIPSGASRIGSRAFCDCQSLPSLTIPGTVNVIGDEALLGCSSITRLNLPYGIDSIGSNAFRNCTGLRTLTIPRSVAYVASWAYYSDQGLSSLDTMNIFGSAFNTQTISGMIGNSRTHLKVLTIGDGMTTVPGRFAEGCDSLVSVNITTPMEQIDYEAFRGCGELTSINIPSGASRIGSRAFCGCQSLPSLTIPGTVNVIGDEALLGCSSITRLNLQDGIDSIGSNAFRNCTGLRTLTIPRSVAYVASWGYYPDQGLSSLDTMNIFCSAFNTQTISGMIGNSRTHLKVLTIGDSMTTVPGRFAEGCDSLVSVNITTPMEQIGYEAFRGCGELTSINIPSGASRIGSRAFCDCQSLPSLTIPGTVNVIGDEALLGCSSITRLNLPYGIDSIGSNAFRNCTGLRTLTIPRSVAYVASWAYYSDQGLSSLDTMNIFGSAFNTQTISGMIGNSRTHLKVLTIGDSMTTVPSRFAEGCDSLVSVNITTPMEQIGYEAFRGCGELTSINIPSGASRIGSRAFCDCQSLPSLTIPGTVNVIGDEALLGCSSIARLDLQDGIDSIGSNAFRNCAGLRTLTIPRSVAYVASWAYYSDQGLSSLDTMNIFCSAFNTQTISGMIGNSRAHLKTLTIGDNTITLPDNFASGCDSLKSLHMLDNITTIGSSAFSGCSQLDTIICEAVVPPTIASSTFQSVSHTIPVFVPCESTTAYETAINWSNFNNYQCIQMSWTDTIYVTICDNQPYNFYGTTYSSTGRYNYRIESEAGDTLHTLFLTVNPTYHPTFEAAICQGQNFTFGNSNYNNQGVYVDQLQTINNCDSIVTLTLTINPTYSETINAEICNGSSYLFNGEARTEAGVYVSSMATLAGCDSTEILVLTVSPTYNDTIEDILCPGSTYEFGGEGYTVSGRYVHNGHTTSGCDSITTLVLRDNIVDTVHVVIYDTTLVTETVYDTITTNVTIYDTVTITDHVTINDTVTVTITEPVTITKDIFVTITEGSVFTIDNQTYNQTGTYTIINETEGFVTQIVTMHLSFATGINDVNMMTGVTIYPNPASGITNVEVEGLQTDATVILYDINGQVVVQKNLPAMQQKMTLDVSSLSSGNYMVRIVANGVNVSRKLVVK